MNNIENLPNDSSEQGYDIGYQKPPKSTQFKAGKSGNPKGRPKGSQNFSSVINKELNTVVTLTENGVHKKVKKKQVVAKQLVNKAAAGDLKATSLLLTESRIAEQSASGAIVRAPEFFAPEDKMVMANILKRLREPQVDQLQAQETFESSADPEIKSS
jgi:hypothetical protein